jgi:prophage regulatory protein
MLDLYRMSATPNPRTILRKEEVLRRTGLKTTRLYELIKKGEFVAQVSLGARAVGWYADQVQDWIDKRPTVEGRAERNGNSIKGARPDKSGDHEPKIRVERELTTAVETAHRDVPSQSQKAKPAHRQINDSTGGKVATAPSDAGESEELRRMRVENSKLKVMLADLMLETEALRSALADKPAAYSDRVRSLAN